MNRVINEVFQHSRELAKNTCHEKRIIPYNKRYKASAISSLQLKNSIYIQCTFSVPGRLSSTGLDLDLDLVFALVLAFPVPEVTKG